MSHRSVFCIVPSQAQTRRVLSGLSTLAFSPADISVLFQTISAGAVDVASTGDSAGTRAAPGKAARSDRHNLSQMAGIEAVAIHGVSSLFSAGPLAAMVVATKPADIATGLINFGVPCTEADFYERQVKEGQVFISVRSGNSDMTDSAKKLFVDEGAENVRTMMDVPSPKNERRREYGRVRAFLR